MQEHGGGTHASLAGSLADFANAPPTAVELADSASAGAHNQAAGRKRAQGTAGSGLGGVVVPHATAGGSGGGAGGGDAERKVARELISAGISTDLQTL